MYNNFLEEVKSFVSNSCNLFLKKSQKYQDYASDPNFLSQLQEADYPDFLSYVFKKKTGESLNLKNPKTFNQKIQWLKLKDNNDEKSQLTDKVLVRNFIKSKIGEEFLKPALWIGKRFDEIPFEQLPDKFIIKANNGSKKYLMIKDKKRFLETPQLVDAVKIRFYNWLNSPYYLISALEMQYKNIEPQIIIEPVLCDENCSVPVDIQVHCFNGTPKLFELKSNTEPRMCTVFDENFEQSDIKFMKKDISIFQQPDDNLKKAVELSGVLCQNFKFVRVDWIVCGGKLYFNDMTFTPESGFYDFIDSKQNIKLGDMLKLN